VKGFPEAPSVIEVQRKGVVAENPKRLVMMAVHVAGEKVKDRHVHEVEQSPTLVVRRDLLYQGTIIGICKLVVRKVVVEKRERLIDRKERERERERERGEGARLSPCSHWAFFRLW